MNKYGNFIERLKTYHPRFDDERLFNQIKSKIEKKVFGLRLACFGGLAILLVGFAFFWGSGISVRPQGELFAEYVFQSNDLNGDQIVNYVFMD